MNVNHSTNSFHYKKQTEDKNVKPWCSEKKCNPIFKKAVNRVSKDMLKAWIQTHYCEILKKDKSLIFYHG